MNLGESNVNAAYDFFLNHMYNPLQSKKPIYEARGVRLGCIVPPSDWEVFASILVDRKGNGTNSGVDLIGYEVKSAHNSGNYEYQYHKDTGLQKLANDSFSDHLFIDHSDFLNKVVVRFLYGSQAKELYFDKWLSNYPNPYPQRYRKNIPYKWVVNNAKVLLVLDKSKITFKI